MNEEDFLEPLERIESVDPPPFLYTRIDARIQALEEDKIPLKWGIVAWAAMICLLLINVQVWLSADRANWTETKGEAIAWVDELELAPSNQLYYE